MLIAGANRCGLRWNVVGTPAILILDNGKGVVVPTMRGAQTIRLIEIRDSRNINTSVLTGAVDLAQSRNLRNIQD